MANASLAEQLKNWTDKNEAEIVSEETAEPSPLPAEEIEIDEDDSYLNTEIDENGSKLDITDIQPMSEPSAEDIAAMAEEIAEMEAAEIELENSDLEQIDYSSSQVENEKDDTFMFEFGGETYSVPTEEYDATVEVIDNLAAKFGMTAELEKFPEVDRYMVFLSATQAASNMNLDTESEDFWDSYMEALKSNIGESRNSENNDELDVPAVKTDADQDYQETVEKLVSLTDDLMAKRDQDMVNAMTRIMSHTFKMNITGISDATMLVAENSILRDQLQTLLSKLGVTINYTRVVQHRDINVDNRVINFATQSRVPLADIRKGCQLGVGKIEVFEKSMNELMELKALKRTIETQRDESQKSVQELNQQVGTLTAELNAAKSMIANEHSTLRGIAIAFNVSVKSRKGEIKKRQYYLSKNPEFVPDADGKIKLKEFRRTTNVSEALLYASKAEAQETVARILKYLGNSKPAATDATKIALVKNGIKDSYLREVRYLKQMEREI